MNIDGVNVSVSGGAMDDKEIREYIYNVDV